MIKEEYKHEIFSSRYHEHDISLDENTEKKAVKLLSDITDIIEKLNIKYWLEGGTCLGAYRDGKMIPWDHDLDLGIQFNNNKNIQDLINILKSKYHVKIKGFTIHDEVWNLGKYRLIKVYPKKHVFFYDKLCLDIFIFYREKIDSDNSEIAYKYVCFNKNGYHPVKYLDSLKSIKFYTKTYKIPNHTDEWLESKYGKDWKTPKKKWHVLINDGTIIR